MIAAHLQPDVVLWAKVEMQRNHILRARAPFLKHGALRFDIEPIASEMDASLQPVGRVLHASSGARRICGHKDQSDQRRAPQPPHLPSTLNSCRTHPRNLSRQIV